MLNGECIKTIEYRANDYLADYLEGILAKEEAALDVSQEQYTNIPADFVVERVS